jgi:sulfofructose kinase
MRATSALLSVGALTYDTIYALDRLPCRPGKYLPTNVVQTAAGMASSAATGAARHGARVSLWATVGNDSVGDILIRDMQQEGIDCSLVRKVSGGRSAIATILVDEVGERLIVPYYDPITHAPPDDFQVDLVGFDVVLVDTRWPGASCMALTAARQAGISGILDADVASPEILDRLLPLASHIVASLPAAEILFGKGVTATAAVEQLVDRYQVFCAVTNGSSGTVARAPDLSLIRIPAYPIKPVDTLAAGDIFHGVFAVTLAETRDPIEAIEIASAAAAIKCLRFGGRLGAPRRTETFEFIEEHRGER